MNQSTDVSMFKKLTDIEHVKTRPGMYLGNTSNITTQCYVPKNGKMVMKELTYNPALLKMFDEIISNAVDEHIRSGKVKKIKVELNELCQSISVEDDGGIPVEIHPEYGSYIPTMIFGELRTGSNFSDDSRLGAGMNGLGAKLTSIFSTEFVVETSLNGKKFKQSFYDGLTVINDPLISKDEKVKNGTKITFIPDYNLLACSLDSDNIDRITKRVYDIAGCNPKIDVFLNGEQIKIKKFTEYVEMFCDNKEGIVYYENKDWKVAFAASSDDTFKHVSFVNGVDTFNGGTHVDYVVNQVTNSIREFINKKHKVDIKPNNIKQQIMVFISCSVNAPIFTSQTKEFMSLDVKDYKTEECVIPDKTIKQLLSSEILERVLNWVEAEQRRKELAELKKLSKETQNTNYLKKIVKFDDASSKDRQKCMLVLTEGDSASKSILSSRDPSLVGVFPLKGKPLNVRDIKVSRLTSNTEFANIMAILGLKLGHDDMKIEDLRFGKLVIATDSDPDGAHICGLVINMFQQFWPELIKQGFLYRLNTPLLVVTYGKIVLEFFNNKSYNDWVEANPKIKHSIKYHKGLGGWSTKDFKRFISEEKYLDKLEYTDDSDFKSIDLAFDRSMADNRKEWLLGETV